MKLQPPRRLLLVAVLVPLALLGTPFCGVTHAQDQWFSRGDVDSDGTVGILDAIEFLMRVFAGEDAEVNCDDAYDFNDDGELSIVDPIYGLNYVFLDGEPIPAPFGECGGDTTVDDLTCEEYPTCVSFPETDAELVAHVLRRIAYGSTPDLFDHVMDIGVGDYIAQQLDPENIDEDDNDDLNDILEEIDPSSDYLDFLRLPLVEGIYGQRQLQTQLADFWDNHFNTDFLIPLAIFLSLMVDDEYVYNVDEALSVTTRLEYRENRAFNDNALGSFHDLVHTSATSVPMLIYLDNIQNIVGNPNENYARELLELHTMGDDNGYTQIDVEEAARVFTGWTVCLKDEADEGDPDADCVEITLDPEGDGNEYSFTFFGPYHDDDEKTLFEDTSHEIVLGDDEDGVEEGLALIEHLSTLPQTAEFVSTKLIRKFVCDDAPPALVADCVSVWVDTDGDLGEVVETILTSDEFLEENRLNKVKTPLEYVISLVRLFGGSTDTALFAPLGTLDLLDALPFFFSTPDGFPEIGDDQLGTHTLREEMEYNKTIYQSFDGVSFTRIEDAMEDRDVDLEDAEAVVEFWMDRLFPGEYTENEKDIAVEFLTTDFEGDDWELDSSSDEYQFRLQMLCAFLAAYPQNIQQ